jgi:hypothetical protein
MLVEESATEPDPAEQVPAPVQTIVLYDESFP